MKQSGIGEELEKALSGGESHPDAEISRKISIISFLSMHPCSTSTAMARFLNTSERGVLWHMDSLIKRDIAGRYEAGKSMFFLKNHVLAGDCPVFAVLSDARARELILLLEESPGMNVGSMASETGLSRQVLSRLLSSMEDAGVVKAVREGRNRRYYLTEKLSELRATYMQRRESAAKFLLETIRSFGGEPEILLERDARLHISVGDHEIILGLDPLSGAFKG